MKKFHSKNQTPYAVSLLSDVELEILRYIKEGCTSTQIAKIRNCSPRTIEKHRSNIIQKLKLKSKSNALFIWSYQNSEILTT